MITIYGEAPSRASRVIWMVEELGLDFKTVPVDVMEGEHLEAAYRARNPLAQVPTIVDGEVSLGESFAINLYLAARYGGPLWAQDMGEQAQLYMWTLFAGATVEPSVGPLIVNRFLLPPPARDAGAAARAEQDLMR
ncbi:MAG: glutathione S-transferase, partial [Caulobacterales bacterium]|nr:glutathione S-transferase [Caulobacterales bacterium]